MGAGGLFDIDCYKSEIWILIYLNSSIKTLWKYFQTLTIKRYDQDSLICEAATCSQRVLALAET